MMRQLALFYTFLLTLSGCLALEGGGQGGIQCGGGQVFDPLSRTCQGASVPEGPPELTLQGVSIREDSGRNRVRLEYTDYENDPATACEVSSDGYGFVREKSVDGVRFRTRSYDPYASNIALEYVDNGPLPTNVRSDDSGPDRIVQIFYQSSPPAIAADIILAMAANHRAAEWLSTALVASPITPVSRPFSRDYFDELQCRCTGGACTLFLDPVSNWSGPSEFTYRLRDQDGISNSRLVPVQVEQVNDPPRAFDGVVTMDEDTIYNGNLIQDLRLPISDASDIETPVQGISFVSRSPLPFYVELVTGPALSLFLANNVLSVQIVPGATTTDQLATAINTAPILQTRIFAINNAPGSALRQHPKTLLRQYISNTSGDSDPDATTLSFELVTPAQYQVPNGTTLGPRGDLTYQPLPDHNSFLPGLAPDTLTYQVVDSHGLTSLPQTITINVNPVDDIPQATSTTLTTPILNEDDLNIPLTTLAWSHPDADTGDDVETCTLVAPNNVLYPVGNCTATTTGISTGTLNVSINLEPNVSGPQTFTYFVTDNDDPADSLPSTVDVTIVEQDDQPWGGFTQGGNAISLIESATSLPEPPISFTLDTLAHPDAGVTQSYRLLTPPANGILTGCLGLGGSSNQDVSCNYVPIDGNVAGEGVRAEIAVDAALTFRAKGAGVFGNDIEVDMIAAPGFTRPAPEPPALAWLEYDAVSTHPIVRISFDPATTTYNDIQSALANSRYFAGNVIEAVGTLGTGVYGGASNRYTLSTGTNPIDSFVYQVVEENDDGDVTTVYVPIEITPTNDAPVICEYTPFSIDQTACGRSGCIGDTSPINRILNPPDGLHYYDRANGTCWSSRGGSWNIVEGHISDKVFNELHPIVVDTIKINEGGGSGTESNQTLELTSITSSNAVLFPPGNVRFFYDQNGDGDFEDAGENLIPGSTFDNNLIRADERLFRVEIHPVYGQVGSTDMEIVFRDDSGEGSTLSFTIFINPRAAHHGGWENVMALGPKINKFNQNRGHHQDICPWSRTLCQTTSKNYTACKGRGSPLNSPEAIPLDPDALYYRTDSGECYRLARTPLGDLDFIARTATPVTLELIAGGVAGSESVSVTNGDISVTIEDGISTTDDILSAIRGDANANNLLKGENRSPASVQSAVAPTAIAPMTSGSWVPFQTPCHISSSHEDTACRNAGLGEICAGHGPPSFVPDERNTSYFDMENQRCYRSIDTTATTDWQEYRGFGRVSLSWNQFNSLGQGSISSYNVYRRLAGTFFNYHNSLNKEAIPVNSMVTYEDNAQNSFSPPLPGTVYYYEVRPVIHGIATNTDESYKTLRVMVPPSNMAFVHRWIANQSMCRLMNASSIDATSNYRCPFEGPGDTASPTEDNFYDIGSDLLVQRFESGCSYTSNCDTFDGECIGIEEPDGNVVAPSSAIYYSRRTGRCHINTSTPPGGNLWSPLNARCDFHPSACNNAPCLGTTAPAVTPSTPNVLYLDQSAGQCHYHTGGANWTPYTCQFDRNACGAPPGVDCRGTTNPGGAVSASIGTLFFNSTTGTCWQNTNGNTAWLDVTAELAAPYTDASNLVGNLAVAELPPLAFVDQEDAASLCSRESISDIDIVGFNASLRGKLPDRKEQIAYSAWNTEELSSGTISARERGLSLNSSSKCNTAEANGLDDFFHDIRSPDSNSLFTLPGTESSGIRSLMTGSSEMGTELCSSRYGVQDHVGNVGEWLAERVQCENFECDGIVRGDPLALSATANHFIPGKSFATPPDPWAGWRLDGLLGPCAETLGACDRFFSPWEIANENFSATRFSIPMGLPIDSDSNLYTIDPLDLTSSEIIPYFVEIAPTNGITESDLHNDTIDIQNELIEREANRCGGFVAGGDYTKGDNAGRWHFTIAPCSDRGNKTQDTTWTTESPKIGFRCLYRIPSGGGAGYEE